jgi:hypothetical protein
MIDLTTINTKIGDREVNLAQEVERFSDQIADLCVNKRKQQAGEPVKIEDWMIRLRCPEDVIDRMFKKEKIKTTMDGEPEVIESFLRNVRVRTMWKYMERCRG